MEDLLEIVELKDAYHNLGKEFDLKDKKYIYEGENIALNYIGYLDELHVYGGCYYDPSEVYEFSNLGGSIDLVVKIYDALETFEMLSKVEDGGLILNYVKKNIQKNSSMEVHNYSLDPFHYVEELSKLVEFYAVKQQSS
ncbi:hypothetical protein KY334_03975 [Candidatus Woesearchaeota archaeon]|nr:hypothetical protein [Candidatus Woesearchaeota archaeon]